MLLKQLTDSYLAQNAYLIGCQKTGEAILIDPERDIDRYLEIAAKEKIMQFDSCLELASTTSSDGYPWKRLKPQGY